MGRGHYPYMLRLPGGVRINDVFLEFPEMANDPDLPFMLVDMHETGCSIYKAAYGRWESGKSGRKPETLYYHLFNAQKKINRRFGRPIGDIAGEIAREGWSIVDPEMITDVERECAKRGMKLSKRVYVESL